MALESFDVPGQYAYADGKLAQHYAELQMQGREARSQMWRGRSTVRTLAAGRRVNVTQGPLASAEGAAVPGYIVLRVTSVGVNNLPSPAQQGLAELFGSIPELLEDLALQRDAVFALVIEQARSTGYANSLTRSRRTCLVQRLGRGRRGANPGGAGCRRQPGFGVQSCRRSFAFRARQSGGGEQSHMARRFRRYGRLRQRGGAVGRAQQGVWRVRLQPVAVRRHRRAGARAAALDVRGQRSDVGSFDPGQTFSYAAKTHETLALGTHIGATNADQGALDDISAPLKATLAAVSGMAGNSSLDTAMADAADKKRAPGDDQLPHASSPIFAVSGKGGLSVTAGQAMQMSNGETIALMSGVDAQFVSGAKLRVNSLQAFDVLGGAVKPGENNLGVQMVAAKDAVDIQAQPDVSLVSANAFVDWNGLRASDFRIHPVGNPNESY